MVEVADVIGFWFAAGMERRWFAKDESFDREVREKLLPAFELARAGKLEHWRDSAEGCVALVVLLDQVPRNLFRDSPQAFASDAAALEVTLHALACGFDDALPQVQRLFLYLPLEHSEDLAHQERCCQLTATLDENTAWHDYAQQHREIVARFGRFPHRNAVLGRETTAEEAAFLKDWENRF